MTTPVDEFLAEQGRLRTPVARFAGRDPTGSPRAFSELIPLSAPLPGRQYAFEVDLDACTGCKACVAACHSLNGLDECGTWRDIGVIVGVGEGESFSQTVTTACHHCADPGCLNGCPVLAYEKDSVTGIVRHLDDQCIGCSYCILKCPYDVPKYNRSRGIVRKCDMCSGRLAHGEAPACVQACPTEAIRITIVDVASATSGSDFLPGAPDPAATLPTTRYLSAKAVTWVEAGSDEQLAPEAAHWPLAIMTTLVGMGTGCTALAAASANGAFAERLWITGCVAGVTGLAASVAHLGQPLRAWRIFLGLRRSWMSREAMLLAFWVAAAVWLTAGKVAGRADLGWFALINVLAEFPWAGWIVAATGAGGLFCSIMIYADTPRAAWAFRLTAPRFLGGAIVLSTSCALCLSSRPAFSLSAAFAISLVGKLGAEMHALGAARASADARLRDGAKLLLGALKPTLVLRCCAAASGSAFLTIPVAQAFSQSFRIVGLALVLLGELAERTLFFQAAAAPRMPGVPRA